MSAKTMTRHSLPSSSTPRGASLALCLALVAACSESERSAGGTGGAGPDVFVRRVVAVTLDGVPVAGASVLQGGNPERWTTDDGGRAEISIDPTIAEVGEMVVMAAHSEARTGFVYDPGPATPDPIEIALRRFDRTDNPAYVFGDPGEPTRRESTGQCAHCHGTINADWVNTSHRAAAKNPTVHDLYAGTVTAIATATECAAAGGTWDLATEPGTGASVSRCHLGDGVLPALNPGGAPAAFGGCADCHAPGIDGELGGRDLLEATGVAFEYGVHCDVCHRTESIDLSAPAGVAGRLGLLRPSEKPPTPGLGEWLPIMFGPRSDVPNPLMGGVERAHFHDGRLCAGCHQLDQPVLVPGAALDGDRWPDATLPIHSTYNEWQTGPLSGSPCASCHMPPDPSVGNGADLYNEVAGPEGVATGWRRAPGAVRRHVWLGPRDAAGSLRKLGAALFIDKTLAAGEVVATVSVENVGAGHAIPTGEPLRSLLLLVEAHCGATRLAPTGGDVVPDFGGYLERKLAGEDWNSWVAAKVGQVVRVVQHTGKFHDYVGFGPFGDGRFSAAEKGMAQERLVAVRTVVGVQGQSVSFDQPLPVGDVAYLGESPATLVDGAPASALAGAAGFGFARVLVGADGRRMVPHFLAVDVASDNRLLPRAKFVSEHRFAASCAEPEITARLVHRAYPWDLARERRFELTESVFAEARK
ncbi:MAG: hypothetical protein KF718_31605 [Polyangiaceae bacterium]|nr:hypothetical protein [Polyangiaceae bacterium]